MSSCCYGTKTKVIAVTEQRQDELSSESDWDGINKEFATSTSCHGVQYWYTSKCRCLKVFWIFLVLGFVGVLSYQITLRIQTYFLYETSTDISEQFVSYLDFPAVTVCNFNRYFLNATTSELTGIYAINQLSTSSALAFASENNDKRTHDALSNLGPDFNVTEYSYRYGFSLNSTVMPRCTFKTEHCSESDFTPIITSLGRCHTFNEGNISRTQNIPGSGHGLSMIIDVQQYLYTEEPLAGIDEAGIKVQVHPPYEEPDVETYGVAVPVGQKAFIEVTRVDNGLMYEPWGRCDPSKESLNYFSTYTLNNCLNECYTNAVVDQCGCRLHTQYWDTEHDECTTLQLFECAAEHLVAVKQNYSASDCNCTIPCTFTDYELTVAYATFPGYTTRNYLVETIRDVDEEYIKENMVKLEVYFSRMSYRTFKQSKKVDESGLLSDVGRWTAWIVVWNEFCYFSGICSVLLSQRILCEITNTEQKTKEEKKDPKHQWSHYTRLMVIDGVVIITRLVLSSLLK
ncbi:bile acid-sensitive ion channel-like isoform X1 [Styela clava]